MKKKKKAIGICTFDTHLYFSQRSRTKESIQLKKIVIAAYTYHLLSVKSQLGES